MIVTIIILDSNLSNTIFITIYLHFNILFSVYFDTIRVIIAN